MRRHGMAAVNGTQLTYEICGVGRPLVLLHGFALDMRMWDAQVEAFSPHCMVIRYDMRGFGQSALPTSKPYAHTADLEALLNYLEIERACVAGLSRGGRWALQFALEYQDRVDALIVADAMPIGFQITGARPSLSPAIVAARAEGVEAARRAWFDHPLFAPARRNPDLRDRLWQMLQRYSGWHWYHEDPLLDSHPVAAQRLGEIAAPMLAVVGEEDLDDYQRAADFLLAGIAHAHKRVIPRAGHMSNMENPGAFNEAVLTFLQTITSAA